MTREQCFDTIDAAAISLRLPPGDSGRDARFFRDSDGEILDGVLSAIRSYLTAPSNERGDADLAAKLLTLGEAFTARLK